MDNGILLTCCCLCWQWKSNNSLRANDVILSRSFTLCIFDSSSLAVVSWINDICCKTCNPMFCLDIVYVISQDRSCENPFEIVESYSGAFTYKQAFVSFLFVKGQFKFPFLHLKLIIVLFCVFPKHVSFLFFHGQLEFSSFPFKTWMNCLFYIFREHIFHFCLSLDN